MARRRCVVADRDTVQARHARNRAKLIRPPAPGIRGVQGRPTGPVPALGQRHLASGAIRASNGDTRRDGRTRHVSQIASVAVAGLRRLLWRPADSVPTLGQRRGPVRPSDRDAVRGGDARHALQIRDRRQTSGPLPRPRQAIPGISDRLERPEPGSGAGGRRRARNGVEEGRQVDRVRFRWVLDRPTRTVPVFGQREAGEHGTPAGGGPDCSTRRPRGARHAVEAVRIAWGLAIG
jgi:hypothetical protein